MQTRSKVVVLGLGLAAGCAGDGGGADGEVTSETEEGAGDTGEGGEDYGGEGFVPPDFGGDGDGDGDEDTVCYPGPARDWTVCLPVVMPMPLPAGYEYPDPYQGDANYREPLRYLDLDAHAPDLVLAPNFTLGEFAQAYKGRYAVVQPHAVAHAQALRDDLGAIGVNSGYRPPAYNADIGGATHSRHMYGDAFDLDPLEVGLGTLESACVEEGGFLVEYETHVHCDWRTEPVDETYFGPADGGDLNPGPSLQAVLERHGDTWTAPAFGFDEGDPLRRWVARDIRGAIVQRATGRHFVADPRAVQLEVLVGGRIALARTL